MPVINWQAVKVDELAAQQGIAPEKFMSAILSEGLYEAYLEFYAQQREAIRAARLPAADLDDDIPVWTVQNSRYMKQTEY